MVPSGTEPVFESIELAIIDGEWGVFHASLRVASACEYGLL